ncbi:MAG: hypothetical protein WCK35_17650 [Chloroflexota bacterium]
MSGDVFYFIFTVNGQKPNFIILFLDVVNHSQAATLPLPDIAQRTFLTPPEPGTTLPDSGFFSKYLGSLGIGVVKTNWTRTSAENADKTFFLRSMRLTFARGVPTVCVCPYILCGYRQELAMTMPA